MNFSPTFASPPSARAHQPVHACPKDETHDIHFEEGVRTLIRQIRQVEPTTVGLKALSQACPDQDIQLLQLIVRPFCLILELDVIPTKLSEIRDFFAQPTLRSRICAAKIGSMSTAKVAQLNRTCLRLRSTVAMKRAPLRRIVAFIETWNNAEIFLRRHLNRAHVRIRPFETNPEVETPIEKKDDSPFKDVGVQTAVLALSSMSYSKNFSDGSIAGAVGCSMHDDHALASARSRSVEALLSARIHDLEVENSKLRRGNSALKALVSSNQNVQSLEEEVEMWKQRTKEGYKNISSLNGQVTKHKDKINEMANAQDALKQQISDMKLRILNLERQLELTDDVRKMLEHKVLSPQKNNGAAEANLLSTLLHTLKERDEEIMHLRNQIATSVSVSSSSPTNNSNKSRSLLHSPSPSRSMLQSPTTSSRLNDALKRNEELEMQVAELEAQLIHCLSSKPITNTTFDESEIDYSHMSSFDDSLHPKEEEDGEEEQVYEFHDDSIRKAKVFVVEEEEEEEEQGSYNCYNTNTNNNSNNNIHPIEPTNFTYNLKLAMPPESAPKCRHCKQSTEFTDNVYYSDGTVVHAGCKDELLALLTATCEKCGQGILNASDKTGDYVTTPSGTKIHTECARQ